MNAIEVLSVVKVLSGAFPWAEWGEDTVKVWVATINELNFDLAKEAVLHWVKTEDKPPSVAAIRRLVAEAQVAAAERIRIERVMSERRQLGTGQPEEPMTVTQLHMWRASMGKPDIGCGCESCQLGKAILAKKTTEAAKPVPGLTEDLAGGGAS